MNKLSWVESFSIKLGRTSSELSSFVSGVLIASAVNVLTSLLWLTGIEKGLLYAAMLSCLFFGLAGGATSVLSWRVRDLQEIVASKTRSRFVQFSNEEERWQFALMEDPGQHRKLVSLTFLMILSCLLTIVGMIMVILCITRSGLGSPN